MNRGSLTLAPIGKSSSERTEGDSVSSLRCIETYLFAYRDSESERMKRALGCFCGVYLEGDNDEELLNWTRAHVSRKHSDMGLTDEQIREMVEEEAYDTQGKAQQKK